MIIDAHATDTVPSHEVRQRALEALANAGEPMSEVTYDALRKRLAESLDLEKSHEALRLGVEAQANLIESQAARIAELESENADLSANQCLHNIHGGEAGNPYCPRITTLEAALRHLDDLIVDLEMGRMELYQVSDFINAALTGGKP